MSEFQAERGKHVELSLLSARRGMRVCTSVDIGLAEHVPGEKDGYLGTIVEVTDSMPVDVPCVANRGKPGALVWWDFLTDDAQYPEVLSGEQALRARCQEGWVRFRA